MTTRLVLGGGTYRNALVTALSERPGRVVVADEDEDAIQTFREEGVAAELVDIEDPEAIRTTLPTAETVVVATRDSETALGAARAAREAFPDAFLLAIGDFDSGRAADIEAVVDELTRPLETTTEFLMARAGDSGIRTRKLMRILRGVDGRLAIVTHDNPDPDAIASAVALERIATAAGCSVDVCYYGTIAHQENRALVNLLNFDLVRLDADADLSVYGGFALVDHSRPRVNDGLPQDLDVDVVIDHHPPRAPVEARFVDLRSEVGATSTLLVDYLVNLDWTPAEDVATGLLFGIRVDTDEFTREVAPKDFEAAAFLQQYADLGTLERVESPSMSADTIQTIARAIRNREQHGPVLLSGVGRLSNRDALAQAADRLLDLEGVSTTFVYGIADGTIYISARTRGTDIDLGETLRDAFGQIGSAGGHADMAGAQISLGLLEAIDEDEKTLPAVVRSIVSDRFLDSINSRTHRIIRDVYPDDFYGLDDLHESVLALDDLDESVKRTDRSPSDASGEPSTDDASGEPSTEENS